MRTFKQNDWNHLHDAILDATLDTTQKQCTQEELEAIYKNLPQSLKAIADEWGMNDTEFRENVIKWYIEEQSKK